MKVQEYFSGVSREVLDMAAESIAAASTEKKRATISTPGTYTVVVDTFAFKDRETNETKIFPDAQVDTKGNLALVLPIKTTCECHGTPAGATLIVRIPLLPSPKKTKDEIDKYFSIVKPRLIALTGEKEPKPYDQVWIEQYLLPEYREIDGRSVLVRDHMMKRPVEVTLAPYTDKDGKTHLTVSKIAQHTESR